MVQDAGGVVHAMGEVLQWGPCHMQLHSTVSCPLPMANMLARTHVRECQVLIDRDPQGSSDHLHKLNEQKLVAKSNEVLEKMARQVSQGLMS